MRLKNRPVLRVSKNALALLFAQAWTKLLSLALAALVARYESAAGLGQYVLVLTVVGLAGVISDLGLNVLLTREVARVRKGRNQRELLGTVLPLKLGLALVGTVILATVALFVPLVGATRALLPLAALLLLPEAAMGTTRSFIKGRQRMEVSSGIDVVVRLLAVGISFPALRGESGVAGVLAATLGANLIGVALYVTALWRWQALPIWQWSVGGWRACLAESYPFALTSLATLLYARADLMLLGLYQGEIAAGWYGAGYRLWETVGLLPASLLDALFPEMSRLVGDQARRQRMRRLFHSASRAMLVIGLLLAAAGFLTASRLIPLIYGSQDNYAPAASSFRVLVCAIPAMFLYLLSGHTLYALGKQRQVTAGMLAAVAINISLNLVAIPRWSWTGAAGVAFISEWLLAALFYSQARRALTGSRQVQRVRGKSLDE